MARKINDAGLMGASVKEPAEPTLESRVSGLEYRASHPNQRSLDAILSDGVNSERFRAEFERCCEQKGQWPWADNADRATKAASATFADSAGEAGKAPIAGAVIWGAVLGAALSLAVLLCFNPAALHRPQINVASHPIQGAISIPMATTRPTTPVTGEEWMSPEGPEVYNGKDFVLMNAPTASATTVPLYATTEPAQSANAGVGGTIGSVVIETGHGRVKRGFRLDAECWVSVNDKPLGVLKSGTERYFNHSVTIRSGCPGSIHYTINGGPLAVMNQSQKPEQSEVVTIP